MRFIAITPNKLDDLDPQVYIKSFSQKNNPDLIIVRDTNASFATKLEFANRLRKFSNASISINAKVNDFAIQKNISFDLHMNADELKRVENESLKKFRSQSMISASCHNIEEINKANFISLDFVLLSPVLINKFNPKLGWKNFSKLAAQCSTKVFALGGMNFVNLEIARKHGAEGIAGISMFTQSSEKSSERIGL